jgi:hypothetical protein
MTSSHRLHRGRLDRGDGGGALAGDTSGGSDSKDMVRAGPFTGDPGGGACERFCRGDSGGATWACGDDRSSAGSDLVRSNFFKQGPGCCRTERRDESCSAGSWKPGPDDPLVAAIGDPCRTVKSSTGSDLVRAKKLGCPIGAERLSPDGRLNMGRTKGNTGPLFGTPSCPPVELMPGVGAGVCSGGGVKSGGTPSVIPSAADATGMSSGSASACMVARQWAYQAVCGRPRRTQTQIQTSQVS